MRQILVDDPDLMEEAVTLALASGQALYDYDSTKRVDSVDGQNLRQRGN